MIQGGRAVFDGSPVPFEEVEGWVLISPGRAVQYLRWLSNKKAEEREKEITDGT